MKKVLMGFAMGAAIWIVAPNAQAQFTPSPVFDTYTNSIYADMTNNRMMNEYLVNKRIGKAIGKRGGAERSARAGITSFRPVAASIAPRALAANASTPEARKSMEATFAELLDYYKKERVKMGAPANDVGRATASFIAKAYGVARGKPISSKQWDVLKEQVRVAMLDNQDFQALSDRQKQEAFEMMAIMGEFIATGYVIGLEQKDKKIQDAFREVAKDQIERFLGTSIDRIKMTDDGLEF